MRRAFEHLFRVVVLVAIAAFCFWVAVFVGLDSRASLGVRIGFAAGGGAFGVLFLFFADMLFRRWRPRRGRHLRLSAEPRELSRGEDVEVTLTLLKPPSSDRRLELRLVCIGLWTSSNGWFQISQVHEAVAYEESREISPTDPQLRHRFTIPASAPCSSSYVLREPDFSWRVIAEETRRVVDDDRPFAPGERPKLPWWVRVGLDWDAFNFDKVAISEEIKVRA